MKKKKVSKSFKEFTEETNQPPGPPGPPPGSKGFGDTVSKFIKKVSGGKIKECVPCKKRKERLNKMLPYRNENNENKVQDD